MEGKVVNDSGYSFLHSSPVPRVDYSVIVAVLIFILILRLKYFLTNYKKKCFKSTSADISDICLLASDLETLSIGKSLNSEFHLEKPITSWLNDLQKLDLLPHHKLIEPHTRSSSNFIKPSIFSWTNSSSDVLEQLDQTDVSLSTITKKLSLFDQEVTVNDDSFVQWREDDDDFMEWMEEGGTSNNGIVSFERKSSSVFLYTGSCIAVVGVVSLFLYTILPEQFVHFL